MIWICILCSTRNFRKSEVQRETMLCRRCGSTWRARATALAVQQGLWYKIQPFRSILSDWSRIGLGISDDVKLSVVLHAKFSYSNSYFDTFPFLDIRNVPMRARRSFEFVTCSDVLEHIDSGTAKAFMGLQSLIHQGGFMVASVPVSQIERHVEFYPNLSQFEIKGEKVHWLNSKGRKFIDSKPEFHGGRGQNLAFRQFSANSFKESLISAGFAEVIEVNFAPEFGVPKLEFSGLVIARC